MRSRVVVQTEEPHARRTVRCDSPGGGPCDRLALDQDRLARSPLARVASGRWLCLATIASFSQLS